MTRSARDRLLDEGVQREAMARLRTLSSGVSFDPSGFQSTHTESRVRVVSMPDFVVEDAQRALGTLATVRYVGDHARTRKPDFWLVVPHQRAWRIGRLSWVVGVVGRLGLLFLLVLRLMK